MGSRGPVPKRSDQRHGHRSGDDIDKPPAAPAIPVPEVDADWHPVAKRWFVALSESGQAIYYEPSDWATAYLMAESISRDLNPQVVGITERGDVVKDSIPLKGASLSAYLKAMSDLLATEGARRRASVELQRPLLLDEDDATPHNVTSMRDRRKRVSDAS